MAERRRTRELNQGAFSRLTPDTAYWIGFLLADGNVWRKNLLLRLSAKDANHVIAFRDFVGSTHAITVVPAQRTGGRNNGEAHVFCVRCQRFIDDLFAYGMTEKKSLTVRVSLLEWDRDFWRGYIDGNGSLYRGAEGTGNRGTIRVHSGSPALLEQFCDFVEFESGLPRPLISSEKRHNRTVALSGKRAQIIIRKLYSRGGQTLARKRIIADLLIEDMDAGHWR